MLDALDLTLEDARFQVARLVGRGKKDVAGEIPMTEAAREAVEVALSEARALGRDRIATEHLLLGVALERKGVGARILVDYDIDVEKIRDEVRRASKATGRRPGRRPRLARTPTAAPGGFERFTVRARNAVVLAQDEARALKHDSIGTEHVLLGLLREGKGLAARALESLEITVEEVRAHVVRIVGQGDVATTGQIPFTPSGKKVLELALREALSLGHNYIGTEHILLGLVRENEGVAARILLDLDAGEEKIRESVGALLSGLTGQRRGGGGVPVRIDVSASPDAPRRGRAAVAVALLAGASLGIGVLLGRLIWG